MQKKWGGMSKKKNIYIYILRPPSPRPPPPYGREGGLTNERPVSGHVIWGPMRGLEKKLQPMAQTYRQTTDRQTDMATLWPTRPRRAELGKIYIGQFQPQILYQSRIKRIPNEGLPSMLLLEKPEFSSKFIWPNYPVLVHKMLVYHGCSHYRDQTQTPYVTHCRQWISVWSRLFNKYNTVFSTVD